MAEGKVINKPHWMRHQESKKTHLASSSPPPEDEGKDDGWSGKPPRSRLGGLADVGLPSPARASWLDPEGPLGVRDMLCCSITDFRALSERKDRVA